MMKKPFKFNELSSERCIDCNAPLKKNLVAKNRRVKRDYVCGELASKRQPKDLKKVRKLLDRQRANRLRYRYYELVQLK